MKNRLLCLSLVAALALACGPRPVPPPAPQPQPPAPSTWLVDAVACAVSGPAPFVCQQPIAGSTIQMHGPNGYISKPGDGAGYAVFTVPADFPDSDVIIDAPGYLTARQHIDVAATHDSAKHNIVVLTAAVPPLPPVPTRAEILNVGITFQGLTVQTQQFGALPWFEPALPWLSPADRAAVYAAKHTSTAWGNGDTHALIFLPSGPALYDEPGQPYSADRFPPLDWTNGNTAIDPQFPALIAEVARAGFNKQLLFLGGDDGERGFPIAMRQLDLVAAALRSSPFGDLRPFVVPFPGFDGVFYGYTPEHIWEWGAKCRALFLYCGIEHSTGHIPTGEGDGDWTGSGGMRAFDLVLSEFDDERFDDTVWQIAARLLGPLYTRDPQQAADDDPGSPYGPNAGQFYLRQQTERGFIKACAFEFYEYTWVRGASLANVQRSRARFKARGYVCGG